MGAFHYIWNGISGLFSAFFSIVGAWVPATYAIYKTNTNIFYQTIGMVLMFIASLVAMVGICGILAYAYFQIVSAVSSSRFPFQTGFVALFAMITLAILFHPVISFFIRFAYFVPAVVLVLGGHQEAAGVFVSMITTNSGDQRGITYSSR